MERTFEESSLFEPIEPIPLEHDIKSTSICYVRNTHRLCNILGSTLCILTCNFSSVTTMPLVILELSVVNLNSTFGKDVVLN